MSDIDKYLPERFRGFFDDIEPQKTGAYIPGDQPMPDELPRDAPAPQFPTGGFGAPTSFAKAPPAGKARSYRDRAEAKKGVTYVDAPEMDTFAGESLGDTAKRRGQQAAQGATEVFAGIPENLAVMNQAAIDDLVRSLPVEIADLVRQRAEIDKTLASGQMPGMGGAKPASAGYVAMQTRARDTINARIEDYARQQWELNGLAGRDPMESDLYKQGDALRRSSEDIFGKPDPRDQGFWAQFAQGAGNVVGFGAGGVAGSLVAGPVGGAVMGGALGSSMNASQLYREAREAGADEETARRAAKWGAALGASEIVPIMRAIKLLPPRLRNSIGQGVISKFGELAARKGSDIAQDTVEEGAQEYLQSVGNNLIAGGLYDPERGWNEGATEAALVGAALGATLGGVVAVAEGRGDHGAEKPSGSRNAPPMPEMPMPAPTMPTPTLTPDDLRSPIPDAVISEGKAVLEAIDRGDPLPGKDTPITTEESQFDPERQAPPQEEQAAPAPDATEEAPTGFGAPQVPGEPGLAPDAVPAVPEGSATAPQVGRYEVLPETEGEGEETGRWVVYDRQERKAQAFNTEQEANAAASQQTVPAQGFGPAPVLDGASEQTPSPVASPVEAPGQVGTGSSRPSGAAPAPQKRPLANRLRRVGVQPGSPLAAELNVRGINTRTHPGLFKASGAKGWDNLLASDWDDYRHVIGEDGNGYLSQDGLIQELENEMRGAPTYVGEQADRAKAQRAAEAEARAADLPETPFPALDMPDGRNRMHPPSDFDETPSQRATLARSMLADTEQAMGMPDVLTPQERQDAVDELVRNGGDVEDVIDWLIRRSIDDAENITSEANPDFFPFGDEADDAARSGDDRGAGPARSGEQPAARGAGEGRADPENARGQEDSAPEGVSEGFGPAPSDLFGDLTDQTSKEQSDRQEIAARQKQSKMRRLDQNRVEDDERSLFGEKPADLFDQGKPDTPTAKDMKAAASETDKNPTEAQKEAENYKTGKVQWNGLTLSIENAKGSTRSKKGQGGETWSVKMPAHYGRILRTEGADGDHVDFYMGEHPESRDVFIIDQFDPETGDFDEHKVMLGFETADEARATYDKGFSDGSGPDRRKPKSVKMNLAAFKDWLENGDMSEATLPGVEEMGRKRAEAVEWLKENGYRGMSIDLERGGSMTPYEVLQANHDADWPVKPNENGVYPEEKAEGDRVFLGAAARKSWKGMPTAEWRILEAAPGKWIMSTSYNSGGGGGSSSPLSARNVYDTREAALEAAKEKVRREAQTFIDGQNRTSADLRDARDVLKWIGEPKAKSSKSTTVQATDADNTVEIKITPEGPWDFNDTYPSPDLWSIKGARENGREEFDAGDPEQIASILDEGLNELQIYISSRDYLREEIGRLEKGASTTLSKKVIAKGETPMQAAERVLGNVERDIENVLAAHADRWPPEAVDAMLAEAEKRVDAERKSSGPEAFQSRFDFVDQKPATRAQQNGLTRSDANQTPDVKPATSWVIRDKATGEVVMETRDRKKVDALNTEKFEAVPIGEHLGELNQPHSKARKAAESKPDQETKPKKTKPKRAPGPKFEGSRQDKTSTLSMEEQDRLAQLRAQMRDKFKNQLNAGLDPEMVAIAAEMASIYIKAGARRFRDLVRAMMEDLGITFEQAEPYARSAYNQVRDDMELADRDISDMDDARAVLADVKAMRAEAKEADNAPGASENLERDRGDTAAPDGLGETDVSASAGSDGEGARPRGGDARKGAGREPGRGSGVSARDAARVGEQGDLGLSSGDGLVGRPADDRDSAGRGDRGEQGLPADTGSAADTAKHARGQTGVRDRRTAQAEADKIAVKPGDEANIRATLPLLSPEQQDDVVKIETRFAKPDGHGMLITNGTGTGKTYTGGGTIKRFVQQGKGNILIVAPSQGIVDHWLTALEDLGVSASRLADTSTAGQGVVATTYANVADNTSLAARDWDLIVSDEAHTLSQNKAGESTGALDTIRAITNRPQDLWKRGHMIHDAEFQKAKAMPDGRAKTDRLAALSAKSRETAKSYEGKPRSKVLFLSATPFAYDQSIDYAEGYLFNYGEDGVTDSGSRQSGRNLFMVSNFGYRIRYHKLTKPEAAVDTGVFEREFHEKLRREGMLSGRQLDIDADYDRRFVLVDDKMGTQIDDALKSLGELARGKEAAPGDRAGWEKVEKAINANFAYLQRQQLLEAVKASYAIRDAKKHLALGRKVVIFHDFNVGGGKNPFILDIGEGEVGHDQYRAFVEANSYVMDLPIERLKAPKEQVLDAFGKRAVEYNGTVLRKVRAANKVAFQTDGSGVDVIVVQSDAGSSGIDLHDTTEGHQRVLINLGMPSKPTTTLQAEGRIRRTGSVSDAIYRYYTIGTTWERSAFAQRIASQAGTVENLALGNEARAIRQSFIEAYEEAEAVEPGVDGEGKGGRERDRNVARATPYDQAKTHYFGKPKVTGKRDSRAGVDWFATPEPLGFKMVEWAGVRPYEKVLEPSAGDGAIARYFPEYADRTLVEPSADLMSRAQLRVNGARTEQKRFEDLHVVNKFDAIVMNPPFGRGGAMAMAHVSKAMTHLKPGGRIVALIPTGSMADKAFARMMDSETAQGFQIAADVALPSVTFERAGTAVAGRVVILDRVAERDGPSKRINMAGSEDIKTFFERLEGISVPGRPEAAQDAAEALLDEQEAAQAETVLGAPLVGQGATSEETGQREAFDVFEFDHTKTGEKQYGVQIREKLGGRFREVASLAREHDGHYSSYRNKAAGVKAGFLFPNAAARQAFMDDMTKPVERKEQREEFEEELQYRRASDEIIAGIMPSLRGRLDRMGLKRVRLGRDSAERQGSMTVNRLGQIDILIGASLDPTKTLYHESIHAMRTMDLFTQNEWRALEAEAVAKWVEKHDILARYPDLMPSEQIEEAIAEEFAEWAARQDSHRLPDLARNAFAKIRRLLRAIREAFAASSYHHPEDVFGRALSGELVRRNASNTGALRGLSMPVGAFGNLVRQSRAERRILGQGEAFVEQVHREAIDAVLSGKKRDTPIAFVNTPAVLEALNKSTNPITLAQRVVWKANADKHGLTGKQIAEALQGLADPIAVFESDTAQGAIVVLVDLPNEQRPVVIAIHPNEKVGRLTVDRIASVHAKDSITAPITWMEMGLLRYLNRRSADAWVRSRGLQLPKDGSLRHRQGTKILAHRDVFKGDLAASQSPNLPRSDSASGQFQGTDLSSPSNNIPQLKTRRKEQRATVPHTAQGRRHLNAGAMGSPHIPDRRIWEELTQNNAGIWGRLGGAGVAAHDLVDRARIKLQDRFLPVLRAQEAVMRANGAALPDNQNAYLAEETFSGKVGRHLSNIDEDFTKPIIDIIGEARGDLSVDEVGLWLAARHALERNQRIADINPDMQDGGSGLMDAEAQDVLEGFANGPHQDKLNRIAALIDGLRDWTLKLREDAGLITHEEAEGWRAMYDHYVPLKGFAETDHSEATLDLTGIGRRFSVRGGETRRALGRRSMAFNPLVGALTQAQEVAIRAEKNRVGQALYHLVDENPSKALWEVKSVKMKRYFNRTTGMVETRAENPLSLMLKPNEMAVKVGGQEKRIIFHDERLAHAAGSVGADQMNWFLRIMSMGARYFSAVNTMLDPEFLIRNAVRDMTAAQINIRNFGAEDRNKIAKAMIATWPKAFVGAYRGQGNKVDSEWTRYYREFEDSGAKVSFWKLEQPEAGHADLKKRVRMSYGLAGRGSRFVRLSTRDNPILGFIERTNLAVDNAVRLAAFVAARKQGWSQADAASLAKNLTVNFNRRGEWGASINALYPFANAGIQGTQILFRAMTSKRMAKYAVGMIVLGAILDQVNASLSATDDDDELAYDKIPDWKNRINLTVMLGPDSGNAATLWLPYGYSLFPYLGQQMSKVARGVKNPGDALADFAGAAFGAFSPIQGGDLRATLTPTILDPINEMWSNQDWLGRPIRPENAYADYGPDAYKFYGGASTASRLTADALNRMSGGDRAQAGFLDVSPEYIDHMAGFVTGGAGRFYGRMGDLASKLLTGEHDMIESQDIPFYRSLQTETGDWLDRDRYYRFRDEVREAKAAAKVYGEQGKAVPENIRRMAGLSASLTAAEKRLKEGRGRLDSIASKSGWSASERRARRQLEYKDQAEVYLEFNKRFLQVAGPQGE